MMNAVRNISSALVTRRLFSSDSRSFGGIRLGNSVVSLAGKVVKEPINLKSGDKSILLKTESSTYGNCVHRIIVPTNRPIVVDQYLQVSGHLQTRQYINADDKPRTEATVRAFGVSVIEASHKDINAVELRGLVATDIINNDQYAMFRVNTSFESKTTNEQVNELHSIRVYDEALRERLNEAVEKSKTVHIIGALKRMRTTDKAGNARNNSYIRAENIFVLSERSGMSSEEGVPPAELSELPH